MKENRESVSVYTDSYKFEIRIWKLFSKAEKPHEALYLTISERDFLSGSHSEKATAQ